MKIGILGCGYVGQALALYWKQKGHQIAVSTRRLERIASLQQIADQVYLLDSPSALSFITQQEALLISVAPDSSSDYDSTYLKTSQFVAQQAIHSSSLKHIIYTSSTSVYGDHAGNWVNETTPIMPKYEQAKILYETEQTLLKCSSSHLNVCIFRLGEIYGPGREIESRLQRTHAQLFAGTGEAYTNLIHLDDIIRGIDFSLEHHLQGIFNLCNDFHIPRRLFYDQLCKKEQIPSIQWDPTRMGSHQGNRRVCNQKLKTMGFTFAYPTYSTFH